MARSAEKPAPTPKEVKSARARLLSELEREGLLLVHDAKLPCATRIIAGETISGSWWGHAKGNLIYEALGHLDDAAWAKLVLGKDTLIHRRLWGALYRVGSSRSTWQLDSLPGDARSLLDRLVPTEAVRADRLPFDTGPRKVGAIAKDLEQRLLIMTDTLHTEGGHHVRILVPWEAWRKRVKLGTRALPSLEQALGLLSAPLRTWLGGASLAGVAPWAPADRAAKTAPPRASRAAPKKRSSKAKSR
jgi:hypothetical protein